MCGCSEHTSEHCLFDAVFAESHANAPVLTRNTNLTSFECRNP